MPKAVPLVTGAWSVNFIPTARQFMLLKGTFKVFCDQQLLGTYFIGLSSIYVTLMDSNLMFPYSNFQGRIKASWCPMILVIWGPSTSQYIFITVGLWVRI
jgi:hypothetical protein